MSIFVDIRPPSGMTLAEEATWWKLYQTCSEVYTHVEDYDLKSARDSATAGARGLHRRTPRVERFPDPGDLVSLGQCIEIDVARPGGEIEVLAWNAKDNVQLWWSTRLTACFVYPTLKLERCGLRPTRSEHALVRTWTDGNYAARSICQATPPTPRVARQGPAIGLTYRSRKFDAGGKHTVYMHHHDDRVVVYEAAGSQPSAIMIRGGKLRLTRHGIAG